ncbi:hypothetical protein F383_13722 [Gossypium arboreum]|uniref:Uncharacterized protein n=1 Tax=Gossypium arboreum TaxID=29729 RepID=A0A0B0PNL9_GOSAR|nr:hypothetical protein F383_13722 [Gossypium arboreum]
MYKGSCSLKGDVNSRVIQKREHQYT